MNYPVEQKVVCYNHPDRETLLRCNRCNRPICSACAVLTPTGYRCRECISGQQRVYDTAKSYDPALGFVIAAVISFGGSFTAGVMGFFTLFLAPLIGLLATGAVRWAVNRRRSRSLVRFSVIGAAIGALPLLVIALLGVISTLGHSQFTFSLLLDIAWHAAYAFLVASTVYYRLSGIQV